ncbi:MAG: DUF397 domain-containing protein [Pseudonocardia sp.]
MTDLTELRWHKSSYSNGAAECVEVAELPDGGRVVRDTKDRGEGPVLVFTPAEWVAFTKGVKAGEFD